MPYTRKWLTWDVVWIGDDYKEWLEGRSSHGISAPLQSVREKGYKGICTGLVFDWLSRSFENPTENAFDRMAHLESNFDQAALIHLSFRNVSRTIAERGLNLTKQHAEFLPNVFGASGLRFTFERTIVNRDRPSTILLMIQALARSKLYLMDILVEKEVDGRPAKGVGHACVMYFDPQSTSTLFDPNFGEYTIPKFRIGQFFTDFMEMYEDKGWHFRKFDFYSVAPKSTHEGLDVPLVPAPSPVP